MKLKKILVSAALSLALGITALAVAVGTKAEKAQEVSAHSTTGLTLVTSANSESFIGCTAYIIGNNTEYGLNTSNRPGKNGTLLDLTIANGTSGSAIQLTRSDGKYLSNLVNGSWSDLVANVYIDSSNRLGTNDSGNNYWRAVKYSPDPTVYYEQYSPSAMGATQSVFYVYAIPAPDPAETEATTFAQTFKDTTDGICKDTSKGPIDTDLDELAGVWNVKATPDGNSLVEKWNALSNDARAVFTAGTANATIADANARYVHIMSRYSETLTAFTDGPKLAGGNTLVTSETSTTNQSLIIAIVAALAIVSVGGFVFIRRRREN